MAAKRDSKDPLPVEQFGRAGMAGSDSTAPTAGGNIAKGATEKHDSKKGTFFAPSGDAGRHSDGGQPTRQNGDGNTPVTGEKHDATSTLSARGGDKTALKGGKSSQTVAGTGDPMAHDGRRGEAGNVSAPNREAHDSKKSSRGGTYTESGKVVNS